jgi:excisionase family DNA binding protein
METVVSTESRLSRSVSLEEAARLLQVCRRTIYYRIKRGQLTTIRTRGGSRRVLLDSIREVEARVQMGIVAMASLDRP